MTDKIDILRELLERGSIIISKCERLLKDDLICEETDSVDIMQVLHEIEMFKLEMNQKFTPENIGGIQ